MRLSKISFLILALFVSALSLGQSKSIIFEGFNNNNNRWSTVNNEYSEVKVTGGDYVLTRKKDYGYASGFLYKYLDKKKDFRISANMKKISGSYTAGYGLVFGRQDAKNQNYFLINANGSFRVSRSENGKLVVTKDWTQSDKIKKGNGASNTLTVRQENGKLTYFINSSIVYTQYTPKYFGSNVGFYVYKQSKIAVAYFSMSYENVKKKTTTTTNNSYTNKTILFEPFTNNKNNWTVRNNSSGRLAVERGDYVLENKRSGGLPLSSSRYKYYNKNRNVRISANFKKVSGVQNYGYGLVFGRKNNDNQNIFEITGNGYFKIMKDKNGSRTTIKSWTKSDKIKQGNGALNTLSVTNYGNKLEYRINSSLVYTDYSKEIFGLYNGFIVHDKQKISVAYFSLRYQDSGSTTTTTTTNTSSTILWEGFTSNTNKWDELDNSNGSLAVQNGDYIINHKRTSKGWQSNINKYYDKSRNVRISARIKKISGIQNNGFGLSFGRKDNSNENLFLISGNGSFQVIKIKDGKRNYIKDWTKSDKIKTGNGAFNTLTVTTSGNKVLYWINSSIVYTSYNKELFGTRTGFIVYDRQKIGVAYLSMSYQDKKGTITNNNNNNYAKHATKESILWDGYTSNVNKWSTASNSNIKLEIKNGDYIFEHKNPSGGWTSTINKYIDTSRDFKIVAQIKKISGIQNNGYGIIFNRKDGDNQNLFYVSGNGLYSVHKVKNGKDTFKKDWASSSAIKQGNGTYNTLKIVKIGSKVEYYINETKVYTDYSPEFFGDRLGYIVYHKQKVAVGYLSVGYLDKKKKSSSLITNFSTDNVSKKYYSDSDFDFSDQFSTNKNNWKTSNTSDVAYKISNGKYRILQKTKSKAYSSVINKYIDTSRDFEIETKIDKVSGVTNSTYGLIFGGKGSNNLRYHITSSGYYQVSREVNGSYQDIIKWTTSSYLNVGNQRSNTLKIRKEDGHFKFYINDKYVNEIDFEAFSGDQIGYFLQQNQEIAVDYLRFKYLKKKNNIVTYKKLTAPVFESFTNNSNGWFVQDLSKYSSKVTGGSLVIDRKESGGVFISKDLELNSSKNFIIKTSIKRDKYGGNGMYGITFGRKNSSNEFSFLLSANGKYKFRKFDNDKFSNIIPFTASSAIKTGMNQANEIKVVKSGGLLRFYINGVYVNEAKFEPFFGNKFGYTVYHSQRIKVDYLDVNYATETFNEPPVVVITEPNVELKRGFNIVKAKKVTVKGKATDKDGIYEVKVNGMDAYLKEDGTFTANVPLKIGSNELTVIAKDLKQATSTKTFVIKRQSPVIKDDIIIVDNDKDKDDNINLKFGKYYALMIGVSEYENEDIPDLAGAPVNDANSLSDILTTKYGFQKENITMLTNNPKKNQILKAFYDLKKKVTNKDNVIIFYAGHGNWSEQEDRGWWMPSDYIPEFEGNSIGNHEIVKLIELIKSKHTLLISDACFSGGVFKETRSGKVASKSVTKKYELTSRRAMTSGNLKEVPNESIFLKYLIKRLTDNQKNFLPASRLFISLEDAVINNTDNTPRYGPIFGAGDEGGDFIFVKN